MCDLAALRTSSDSRLILIAPLSSLHLGKWCFMHDVSCEMSHDVVAVISKS